MQHTQEAQRSRRCRFIAGILQDMRLDTEPFSDDTIHGIICDKQSESAFFYTITPQERVICIRAYRKFPPSAMEDIQRVRNAVQDELLRSEAPCSRWKVFIADTGAVPCIAMESYLAVAAKDWEAAELMGRKIKLFFSSIRSILPAIAFARF